MFSGKDYTPSVSLPMMMMMMNAKSNCQQVYPHPFDKNLPDIFRRSVRKSLVLKGFHKVYKTRTNASSETVKLAQDIDVLGSIQKPITASSRPVVV